MRITEFTKPSGSFLRTIGDQQSFVPHDLPPDLDLAAIQQLLSKADRILGELRGIGTYLSNPYLLIRPLQRREAIASSNIEGTYTSLPELLMFESGLEDQPRATDTREVYNYIAALKEGFDSLEDIPVSNRLILQLHKRLLRNLPVSRAGFGAPGEFRREQNFIGRSKDISKARFIPPAPPEHLNAMNKLEVFLNDPNMGGLPPLVYIALIHYQFETIHPFPDGNGRVGRLLIPIILKQRGIMGQPLLYMSQYFEDNKEDYVDLMLSISKKSQWVPWIQFFLEGVVESCSKTTDTIRKVQDLRENYLKRVQQARSSALLMQIIDMALESIIVTIPQVRDACGISYTAAQNNVYRLVEEGILNEALMSTRPKYYFATELLKLFED